MNAMMLRNTARWFKVLMVAAATTGFAFATAARADGSNPPPVVVSPGKGNHGQSGQNGALKGMPPSVKVLVTSFDQTRDKYLQQQAALTAQLKKSATPEQRDQIRSQLQANRAEFMDELKNFREQFRDDLKDMKGKMSQGEFQRVIDAAQPQDAASGPAHGHKGQH
jgi:hypothetical protein